MDSTKRIKHIVLVGIGFLGILSLMLSTIYAYADTAENQQLTSEQKDAIIQNCGNIKQSLIKLQHSDSRTRAYLGAVYETVAGKFLTPLNLRLVKNGLPSSELFQIQNDFTVAQTEFRSEYVDYMRELEALTAVDCVLHPQEFYDKLEGVRERRIKLRVTTEQLAELIDLQYQTVETLRASL